MPILITTILFFSRSKKDQKPKTVKRKAPAPKKSPPPTSKAPGWQFDSESEDEVQARQRSSKPKLLQSVLTRRVADGSVRRTEQRDGDVFIDLKIYNVRDILSLDPKDRWEQAVVSLKYQADFDAPELAQLKDVVKKCKENFTEEGKFFSSKKK